MRSSLLKFAVYAVAMLICACGTAANSQQDPLSGLPEYRPNAVEGGIICSWGHVFVKKVMDSWEREFQKYHPDITFSDNLVSSAAATGALFTKTAEIGVVGREIRPMEVAGYTRVMKHKPSALEVMTGSFANADKSVALGIFVQKDNPLQRITFAQLDAIFGSEHKTGEKVNLRTWGQLGLTGNWANRPISVYAGELDAAPAFYFSQRVMLGSMLWNESLHHFDDANRPDGTVYEAQQQIVDALARDPGGIAISGAGVRNLNVKLVAISESDSGPYVEPTLATVQDRSYPLSRSVWFYTNQAPEHPLDPRVREFLLFILSRQGQALVHQEGEYFPLTPELDAAQIRKLQ